MRLNKEQKEERDKFDQIYESMSLSELHGKSIEIASRVMKLVPNTWESALKQNIEYNVIVSKIKELRK